MSRFKPDFERGEYCWLVPSIFEGNKKIPCVVKELRVHSTYGDWEYLIKSVKTGTEGWHRENTLFYMHDQERAMLKIKQ